MRTEDGLGRRRVYRSLLGVLGGAGSLAVLVGLSGCFSLGRTEPDQQHYVLGGTLLREPPPPVQGAILGPLSELAVGVRRTQLAPYLEPPFLVVREGPHEITYSEYHRWGEQPGVGINRAVAGHLAARGSFQVVDAAPWPARTRHDYLVQLHVEHFEGVAPPEGVQTSGEAHMRARWEILRPSDGEVVARGTTDHRQGGWVVGDFGGLVRLLDTGLGVLAGDVLAGLETVLTLPEVRP
jgi:uncharacterized lipoprotein YmbA